MPSTTTFNYEIIQTRFGVGTIGQPSTIQQTLVIERKTGNIDLAKDVRLMLSENLVPELNEYYNVTSPDVRDWAQYARFRGYDAEYLGNGKVRMTLKYATLYSVDPTVVAGQELAMPASTDYQSMIRTTKIFRTGYTTNPPPTLDSTTADIGGANVQGTRGGRDIQVPQMRIRLRLVQNADLAGISTTAGVVALYVNRISNAVFLGFPAYSVICEGASLSTLEGEFYEVVFDFLYDTFYHHEQVVQMAADGRPDMSAGNYTRIDWKRFPRSAVNFNDIFGTNTRQKAIAEKGFY